MAQPQPTTRQEGIVTHANDRGIRLNGAPDWLNVSRFRPVDLPPVGARVAVDVQADGWLAGVTVLDAHTAAVGHTAPSNREQTITRLACLRSAVQLAAHKPDLTSTDVLKVAERFEAWVTRDGEAEA